MHRDGKWGWFHSLSQFYGSPLTTEQAFRRLERLGYTLEDACNQKAVMDYVVDKEDGVYYIYGGKLSALPHEFESRKASRYLAAIKLLSEYRSAKKKLKCVADWLEETGETRKRLHGAHHALNREAAIERCYLGEGMP